MLWSCNIINGYYYIVLGCTNEICSDVTQGTYSINADVVPILRDPH